MKDRRTGPEFRIAKRGIGAFLAVSVASVAWTSQHSPAHAEHLQRIQTQTASCTTARVINSWSIARRAAQLVVVPVDETNVSSIAESVQDGAGGVVLFGNQAPSDLDKQLKALNTKALGHVVPFIMTDEEGGGVQRMPNLVGSIPWPRTMAASLTVANVQLLAQQLGRKMAADGVTMDLGPVLDISSGPGPDALHTDGPRSFSGNPTTAASYGVAFAVGLLEGGVIPVVKHFPGEGRASNNTDYGPATTPPIHALEDADLIPFEKAIHNKVPAIMVGNATVPGLSKLPSSISPEVITTLLRQKLAYKGLILTDSLSVPAISKIGISVPTGAVDAILAGADMVLFSSATPNTETQQIVSAVVGAVKDGHLPVAELNQAVDAVLTTKKVALCP